MDIGFIVASAVFLGATARAAPLPWQVSFQGRLTAASGQPAEGPVDLTFSVYDAPSGGHRLWGPETHAGTALANGAFSVRLGSLLPLSTATFAAGPAYLGLTVGAGPEMAPRQQLAMSPYAAATAMLAGDGDVQLAAGVACATFTAAGNLRAPYGLSAATAAFASVTAGSGTFSMTGAAQYSLQTSSGLRAAGGTLRVDGAGGAALLYGLRAATGAFTAAQNATYALSASSGALMPAGTLRLQATARGLDASGTGVLASTLTLKAASGDPPGTDGMMAYDSASGRFRCRENGSWTNCLQRGEAVSLGVYTNLLNVGTAYDNTDASSGLGHALVDFSDVSSMNFYVYVEKIGSGTQDWQLWNETDSSELAVLSDAGAAGTKWLNTTVSAGLPTGMKLVRVRTRSTVKGDDPNFLGATLLLNH